MCAKKKSVSSKVWKLAGEQVSASALTTAEREIVADEFAVFRKFRNGENHGVECVTQAAARVHEGAAAAVAGFLCGHYEGRFKRDTVVKVISVSAAIPANWAERIARREDFLMGAALWLLDYLEDTCEDPDEYLTLLPVEPDDDLEYYMPCAEDMEHSRETVLRMMTVLEGREKAWRREFRALLSMIDADTAASLRALFKTTLLDYLDRAIEVYERLKPLPKELPSFLTSSAVSFDTPLPMDPREEKPEIFFLHMAPRWITLSQPDLEKELHSRKAAELLAGFRTDAPYELCVAYLLLEREGDALANLNGLTSVILISATHHLPWAHDDFGARAGLFQRGTPDYQLRYEYCAEQDEDDEGLLEVGSRLSESQLFLIATGMVLPRRRVPSDELIRWFMRQGLEEQRARELAWAAFIAYYTENGEHGWREIDLFDDDEMEYEDTLPQADIAEPSEALPDTSQGEETQARFVELTRQVKELRNALHDAERAGSRLKEQL